jgi:hypothetical protein
VRFDSKNRAPFTGNFQSAAHARIALTVPAEGDGLKFQIDNGLLLDAFPVGGPVLYVPGLDYFIALSDSDASGKPAKLHVRSMYVEAVLDRAAASNAPPSTAPLR